MDEQVVIEEYNADWPRMYEQEKIDLIKVFNDKNVVIEHFGSTSIKGLEAKPILDIMVAVRDLEEVDEFIRPLEKLGYEYVEHKEFPNRRFFRKGARRAGTHHLHVYKYNSGEWNNKILFRDYLRTHPTELSQYARLKKVLAEKYKYDRPAYTKAKEPFIQEVIKKAKGISPK